MNFQLSKIIRPRSAVEEIMSTWPKLNKELMYHEKFGKFIKSCKKYAKKTLNNELKIEGFSDSIKTIKIIEHVKSNYTWNGIESKYTSQSPKKFYKNKNGNAAEINLFLIALLKQAKIECSPLILSSRSNGKIKSKYPFDIFTNYVVVYIHGEKPYLADGTEEMLPFNRIPPRCINESGLIVNKEKKETWLSIKHLNPSIEMNSIILKVNPEASLITNTLSHRSTDYSAYLVFILAKLTPQFSQVDPPQKK